MVNFGVDGALFSHVIMGGLFDFFPFFCKGMNYTRLSLQREDHRICSNR